MNGLYSDLFRAFWRGIYFRGCSGLFSKISFFLTIPYQKDEENLCRMLQIFRPPFFLIPFLTENKRISLPNAPDPPASLFLTIPDEK